MTNRRQHKWWRAAPPLIVVAVGLAFTAAASAQTTFQARVIGINPKPDPPCAPTMSSPNLTGIFCGSANIAGYGPATWTLNGAVTSSTTPCFSYTGTTTLQLLSGDGTLVLDETGTACSPGNSASAPRKDWFGVGFFVNASWRVDPVASTGIFAGVTGGGTDTGHSVGTSTIVTYTGTLTPQPSS
jgi:hypothetical protein